MSQDQFEFLWSEYEKQLKVEKEQQQAGLDILPSPGFVLKTW
jgi:hypothetical protein